MWTTAVTVLAIASAAVFVLRATIARALLPLYHAIMAWQVTSEIMQMPFTDPPMPELVLSRAMALTQLDAISENESAGPESRRDFAEPLQAALHDAWDARSSRNAVLGVFRAFMLDAVTEDLGRRLKLMDALITNSSICDIAVPKVLIITGVPFAGTSRLAKHLGANPRFHYISPRHLASVTGSLTPREREPSMQGTGPIATQYETLLRRFASPAERLALAEDDGEGLRLGCSAYLNCTLPELRAFGRLPLPSLDAALAKRSKIRDAELFKRMLQVQLSHLPVRPDVLVVDGTEHAAHLPALYKTGLDAWVVHVKVAEHEFRTCRDRIIRQTRVFHDLVLGPHRAPPPSTVCCSELQQDLAACLEADVKPGHLLDVATEALGQEEALRVVGLRVEAWVGGS